MSALVDVVEQSRSSFEHEALFVDGVADLVEAVAAFVSAGVAAGEPVLVALPTEHLGPVRSALGSQAASVEWVDMRGMGTNPARIIPAWGAFVDQHRGSGQRLRGVGEPIWASRTADELVECQLHEQLLNVAFADSGPWTLLCPYDVDALAPEVIEVARQSHHCSQQHDKIRSSAEYRAPDGRGLPGGPLPVAPSTALQIDFTAANLAEVRDLARQTGEGLLGPARTIDHGTAVHEIAANSVRHGGGGGTASAWTTAHSVVVEVSDGGWITDPLAGRRRPELDAPDGRGLWMANQLCDLVQLRSTAAGTTVRLHQHLP